MNELLFFSHLTVVLIFMLGALRLGKGALITIICLQAALANLFVMKQIVLFGLHVTSCDVYTIGAIFGINLLQEYHPDCDVKRVLLSYFGTLVFFPLMAQFHLYYQPANLAYEQILGSALRIFFASITTSMVTTWLDTRLFATLKSRYANVPFALRIASSALCIQLLDTLLFTFLGLWGSVSHPWELLFFSYLIKVITIITMSMMMGSVKRVRYA